MTDNSRIKSGYDVEILLGELYFLEVVQAAYDANKIQRTFTLPSSDPNKPPSSVVVERPHDVQLVGSGPANLHVSFKIITALFPTPIDAGVDLNVEIADGLFNVDFIGFDGTTRANLLAAGGLDDAGVDAIENDLRANVATTIDLGLNDEDSKVAEIAPPRILGPGDGHATAFAIYVNLDLTIADQSDPPETAFTPRGNADLGVSFLKLPSAFAIGVSPETFERFANDSFHKLVPVVGQPEIEHPMVLDGKVVGDCKSVKMKIEEGRIKITIRFKGIVDNFPDVPVKIKFSLTARTEDGKLKFDVDLDSFDADAGILGDVIAYVAAASLGMLLVMIFGATVAAAPVILGTAGVIGIELVANIKGDQNEDAAEGQGSQIAATVSSAFSAYPTSVFLFTDKTDPFFEKHFTLKSAFDEVVIDENGMGMSGHVFTQTVNTFPFTQIIGRELGDDQDSRFGVSTLSFRINEDKEQEHTLSMNDVLSRIGSTLSDRILLKPVAIRSKLDLVREIKFDTGVEFQIEQVVDLNTHRVFRMRGFQSIQPESSKAYVRGRPDESEENNLESLPQF